MTNALEKNKFHPKFVNILRKFWKTEYSLNITNTVIFYFQEYLLFNYTMNNCLRNDISTGKKQVPSNSKVC